MQIFSANIPFIVDFSPFHKIAVHDANPPY
jgi:hypothetical protein